MEDSKMLTLDIHGQERMFRISRFKATTGAFILFKLTSVLAPLFEGNDGNPDSMDIGKMLSVMGKIPQEEFEYIQKQALMVCHEMLASPAPVMRPDGTYGVIGLEMDTISVLKLTMHSLVFNLKDFFTESGMGEILKGLIPEGMTKAPVK